MKKAQQKETKKPKKQETETEAISIGERLRRMISDADAIKERLLGAPLGLTGSKEPELWETISKIRDELASAQKAWQK